jgi:hypothetical protein
MFYYSLFTFFIPLFIDNIQINNYVHCFSKLLMSLMAMNPFCKSCTKTDASLHYVTFIKPCKKICQTKVFVKIQGDKIEGPHYFLVVM